MSDQPTTAICGKVLVVCDDEVTGDTWIHLLGRLPLEAVRINFTHEEVLAFLNDFIPDLMVIDTDASQTGPVLDLCSQIRTYAILPIILLAPGRDEDNLLEAYQAGVDDYLAKPVSPALFLAKIRVWQRRTGTVPLETLSELQVGDLRLIPAQRLVETSTGSRIKLTNLELRLLYQLMSHPGRVMNREVLMERVWDYCGEGDEVALKNVIYRLRKKIETDPGQPIYIITVPHEGYAFQSEG